MQTAAPILLACLVLSPATVQAVQVSEGDASQVVANPIRKVVSMLQMMQKKVTEEGKAEEKLYSNFECYCKTSGGDLGGSISAANNKIPQVESAIAEAESKKAQLEEELKQHRADRDAAKAAMADATAVRENEAAEFAKKKGDDNTNVDAITKAIAAITAGTAGSFLQTRQAQTLQKMLAKQDLSGIDKQTVLSFLSGSQGYAPQSGEVVGILKQLKDDMLGSLAEATAAEEKAIKIFNELMAAKKKEIEALTGSIEEKVERVGELGVKIVQMKDDLAETQEALAQDQQFLADLKKNCGQKQSEWEERQKTRSEELAALAETITVLNDDDALELFKKRLPSPSAAFVELGAATKLSRTRALHMIRAAQRAEQGRPDLDFIALAIQGKAIGFEKVIEMIDKMIATLHAEQEGDLKKKENCAAEIDAAEDKEKTLQHTLSTTETAIEVAEEDLATLKSEIAALEAGIKALDKSVAEATEQRKAEHDQFTELLAEDTAAKELLNFAKNRLYKFYDPKMHKPAPKAELSRMERINVNLGGEATPTAAPGGIAGTGIAVLTQVTLQKDAPPPPPETFGAYTKKSGESTGVIAMIDLLIKDLDKDVAEAQTEEELSQKDYEEMMSDSKAKRAQDSKALNERSSAKAETEAELDSLTEKKQSTNNELMATAKHISALHGDCDWLLQHFDARKEARSREIDALGNAKAVLKGADYE